MRRVLIEGAWTYRYPARVSRPVSNLSSDTAMAAASPEMRKGVCEALMVRQEA